MEQEKLFEKVKTISRANNLFKQNDKIIVGLSGGPDSVFLLHFLLHIKNEYNLELIAAHLDHQWRDNSNIDAKFCADLCANLNVTFISEKAENLTPSKKFNGSKEEFARNLRRSFFENLLKKFEANSIALAHQKDDQIETFFLRLYRGTSLAGLTGIKIKNENYIRPLLNTNKSEILDMLHANNIKYVIDPTNENNDYLRNKIRNILIPAATSCDNRFLNNLENARIKILNAQNFIDNQTNAAFNEIFSVDRGQNLLDIENFFKIDPYLQENLIIKWLVIEGVEFTPTTKFIAEIKRFLSNQNSQKHQIHHSWAILKANKKATIIR